MKDTTINFLFILAVIILLATPVIVKRILSVQVLSSLDNRYYTVRRVNSGHEQRAADILAELNERNLKLIKYLQTIDNGSFGDNVKLFVSRYQPDNLSENIFRIDTSYTINKGQSMEFCLDNRKDNPEFHDINTLMYVLLHEDAHEMSVTYDHSPEFLRNFAYLTKKAIELGVYNYIDYSVNNAEFCGMTLKNSILTK